MNTFSNKDGNKIKKIIFMIFVFMLVANGGTFAKTSIDNNVILNNTTTENTTENNVARQETTSTASNMNFVLWFMGSKQDPNVKTIKAGENTRRQFITSGLAPNRLLLNAFLKKALNSEIAAA